jgi:hypothetical protein
MKMAGHFDPDAASQLLQLNSRNSPEVNAKEQGGRPPLIWINGI